MDSAEVNSATWPEFTDEARMAAVRLRVGEYGYFEVVHARASGETILRINKQMNAAQRGQELRKVERDLRMSIDPSITIYLEPMLDKNRVRFRGVKIKE